MMAVVNLSPNYGEEIEAFAGVVWLAADFLLPWKIQLLNIPGGRS
jgi:hypothetical protein